MKRRGRLPATTSGPQRSLWESQQRASDLEWALLAGRRLERHCKGRTSDLHRLWKEVCEQEIKAHIRNKELLQDFQRIEAHIAALSQRTEDLREQKVNYTTHLRSLLPPPQLYVQGYGQQLEKALHGQRSHLQDQHLEQEDLCEQRHSLRKELHGQAKNLKENLQGQKQVLQQSLQQCQLHQQAHMQGVRHGVQKDDPGQRDGMRKDLQGQQVIGLQEHFQGKKPVLQENLQGQEEIQICRSSLWQNILGQRHDPEDVQQEQKTSLLNNCHGQKERLQKDEPITSASGESQASSQWMDTEYGQGNRQNCCDYRPCIRSQTARALKSIASSITHTNAFLQAPESISAQPTEQAQRNGTNVRECQGRCMCHEGRSHHPELACTDYCSGASGSHIYHRSLRNPRMAIRPFDITRPSPHLRSSKVTSLKTDEYRFSKLREGAARPVLQWDICPRCAWPGEIDTSHQHTGRAHNQGSSASWEKQQRIEQTAKQTTVRQRTAGHCSRSDEANQEDHMLDTKPVRLLPASSAHSEPQLQPSVNHQPGTKSLARSILHMKAQCKEAKEDQHSQLVHHWQGRETTQPCHDGTSTPSEESSATSSIRVRRSMRLKKTEAEHGGCVPTVIPKEADSPYTGRKHDYRNYRNSGRCCHVEGHMRKLVSEESSSLTDSDIQGMEHTSSLSRDRASPSGRHSRKHKNLKGNSQNDFLCPKTEDTSTTCKEHPEVKHLQTSHIEVSSEDGSISGFNTKAPAAASALGYGGPLPSEKDGALNVPQEVGYIGPPFSEGSFTFPSPSPDERLQQTSQGGEIENKMRGLSPTGGQLEETEDEERSDEEWITDMKINKKNSHKQIKGAKLDGISERTNNTRDIARTGEERSSQNRGGFGESNNEESNELSSSSESEDDEVEKKPINTEVEQREDCRKKVLNMSARRRIKGGVENRETLVKQNLLLVESGLKDELLMKETEGMKKLIDQEEESESEENSKEDECFATMAGHIEIRENGVDTTEEGRLEKKDIKKEANAALGKDCEGEQVDVKRGMTRDNKRGEEEVESEEDKEEDDPVNEMKIKKESESTQESEREEDTDNEGEQTDGEERGNVDVVRTLGEEGKPDPQEKQFPSSEEESEEGEEGCKILGEGEFSDDDQESCPGSNEEEDLPGFGDSDEESEDTESDEGEDEGAEKTKNRRNSKSGMESLTTDKADVPEGMDLYGNKEDQEEEIIKVVGEKGEMEPSMLYSDGPAEDRGWLKSLGCLTCVFPRLCRKRVPMRRSSQDSIHDMPGLHPTETTLAPVAISEDQSQDNKDSVTSSEIAGLVEASEGSSSESEEEMKQGKRLEKEDFDGFYD